MCNPVSTLVSLAHLNCIFMTERSTFIQIHDFSLGHPGIELSRSQVPKTRSSPSLTLLPVCRAPLQQQNLLWLVLFLQRLKGRKRTTNLNVLSVQGLSILEQSVAALVGSVQSFGAEQSCKFLSRQYLPFVAEDAMGCSPARTLLFSPATDHPWEVGSELSHAGIIVLAFSQGL